MSAAKSKDAPKTVVARTRKLSVEDVRKKMENVQKVARDEVQQVVQMDVTKVAIGAVVGVALIAGVAYFAGSRAGRKRRTPPPRGHAPSA